MTEGEAGGRASPDNMGRCDLCGEPVDMEHGDDELVTTGEFTDQHIEALADYVDEYGNVMDATLVDTLRENPDNAVAAHKRCIEETDIFVDMEGEGAGAGGHSMTDRASRQARERRVRCSCGFQTGWFDPEDANHIAEHHGENCEGEVEYREREKEERNHSDNSWNLYYLKVACPECDDPREYECGECGARFMTESQKDNHELGCMGI